MSLPDDLPDRLDRATPAPPDVARFARLAADVEYRGRRRRSVRRVGVVAGAAAVVTVVVPLTLAAPDESNPAATPTPPVASSPPATGLSPSGVPAAVADRADLDGEAVWVRFCPGREGWTDFAEVPSDALTDHLEFVSTLREEPALGGSERCDALTARGYRLQIGFADGRVVELVGRTDPDCPAEFARIDGITDHVIGPEGLGVYGAAMAAFGEHYADRYAPVVEGPELTCPGYLDDLGTVARDGESAGLETGWHLGRRSPMFMPVTAVRGIRCTYPFRSGALPEPTLRPLTPFEAERVRIGMHAVNPAMVDCPMTFEPTFTAVVADVTGTVRAVTVADSQCGTVSRSDGGYGLGFAWLDR